MHRWSDTLLKDVWATMTSKIHPDCRVVKKFQLEISFCFHYIPILFCCSGFFSLLLLMLFDLVPFFHTRKLQYRITCVVFLADLWVNRVYYKALLYSEVYTSLSLYLVSALNILLFDNEQFHLALKDFNEITNIVFWAECRETSSYYSSNVCACVLMGWW